VATYPRRVARTGVLQGDAANANVRPARYACTPENNTIKQKKEMILILNKYNHCILLVLIRKNDVRGIT
jgi:hypothetical protein